MEEKVLFFNFEEKNNIKLGYTTKSVGNMIANDNNDLLTTIEDRRNFANSIGVHLDHFVFGEQNHTINITEVFAKDGPRGTMHFSDGVPNADGLYTKDENLVLGFFFADCMPIYFTADDYVGILHCGLQGCLKDFAYIGLAKFIEATNVNPEDVKLIIGPRGSKKALETNVHSKFVSDGHFDYDLMIVDVIKRLGIPEKNVAFSNIFTDERSDLYSYYNGDIYSRACGYIYKEL